MLSKLFKLLFVITAYAPILLICWIISVFTFVGSDKQIHTHDFSEISMENLTNKYYLVVIFVLLIILCRYILHLANAKLTRSVIEVKSIRNTDLNMNSIIFSYFLPFVELYKKDIISIVFWVFFLLFMIFVNNGTHFSNPLMKLFGFKYFEISTNNGVTYTIISKRRLINKNDIETYSQLTDYVIFDSTKK
jgi:hypothetical protein